MQNIFIGLAVVALIFLILYNMRNARKSAARADRGAAAQDEAADGQSGEPSITAQAADASAAAAGDGAGAYGGTGGGFAAAESDRETAPNTDSARLQHAGETATGSAGGRPGSGDRSYREALRRFADTGASDAEEERGADNAYRDALRAMRGKRDTDG